MDKSQHLLSDELAKLRTRIESEPKQVLKAAESCAERANSMLFYLYLDH
ncbi:hypothetical protein [Vibrio ponticus]|nr:hypothetical protein [Vibrio ponticus]